MDYACDGRSYEMTKWTLILFQVVVCHSYSWISTLPTFVEPDSLDLYRAVVDPSSGDLVVAGRNVIYRLTSDLEVIEKSLTGPELDHPDCFLKHPCDARLKKKVDNDNQVLLLLEDDSKLLVCGTLYQGLCQIRYLAQSIEAYKWLGPFNDSLGFLTITPSIFRKSLLDYSLERPVLWSALHDDPEARRPFSPPFLSRKFWVEDFSDGEFENTFESSTSSAAIRFEGNATRYVIEGFKHGNHIYFLIVHTYPNDTPTTRLARVCAEDLTLRSYSELVLACDVTQYGMYDRATAAWWGKPTPWLMVQHLWIERQNVLFINMEREKLPGSAVCGFNMSDVEDAFESDQRRCLAEEEPIHGMDCRTDLDYLADNCGKIDHPYLLDQKLMSRIGVANVRGKLTITAFAIFEQNGVSMLIAATNESSVLKANLERRSIYTYNNLLAEKEKKHDVSSPLIFDKEQKHIYFIVKDKVVKYPLESCSAHMSCPRCLVNGKTDPLPCAWCDGRCSFIQDCHNSTSVSLDTCPPTITKISYNDSLTEAGITIKISGYAFGSYINSKHNNISVSDLTCEVETWNDTQVICTFTAIPSSKSLTVRLSTTNLNQTIPILVATSTLNLTHYRVPELYAIFPSKGPISGGTHVIIFGKNLNFGSQRVINLRGRICEELAINVNAAWCVTGKTASSELSDSISFEVDNQTFELEIVVPESFNMSGRYRDFKYLPDPEIYQIYHGVTTVSGLMNVSVVGRYLDSVETPEMIVRIVLSQSENELEFKKPCWSAPESEGRTLTCRTPSLKNQPGIPLPTRTFPLVTHVTFLLDGVDEVRNLHRTKEAMSRLMYFPDPEIPRFRHLRRVLDNETLLEIQGQYLDLIQNPDNFHVKIGDREICKIIKLHTNYLECELPPNLLQDSSVVGANFSVEVTMGFSTQQLGFISIVASVSETSVWKLVALVVTSCILIGIVAFCCWKCRMAAKPFKEDGALSAVNRNENDYSHEMSGITSSTRISNHMSEFASPSEEEPLVDAPLIEEETLQILQENGLLIETHLLILGKEIGAGQFGCVYDGLLRSSNNCTRTKVAIKTLRNVNHQKVKEKVALFMQEALCMKDFKHPNVLSLIGISIDKGMPLVVLPYMENGDLCNYLRDTSKIIPESSLLQFAVDIATGMAYLASSRFVHRDLATRNCVLDSNLSVRVADFGLSRDIYESALYASQNKKAEVPYKWMAPDALEKGIYSEYTDVWSYGILLWELMTHGMTPYPNVIGYWNTLEYLKQGQRLPQPENCPDDLYALMRECWNEHPNERPPFENVKNQVIHIAAHYMENNENNGPGTPPQNSTYLTMS